MNLFTVLLAAALSKSGAVTPSAVVDAIRQMSTSQKEDVLLYTGVLDYLNGIDADIMNLQEAVTRSIIQMAYSSGILSIDTSSFGISVEYLIRSYVNGMNFTFVLPAIYLGVQDNSNDGIIFQASGGFIEGGIITFTALYKGVYYEATLTPISESLMSGPLTATTLSSQQATSYDNEVF